MKILLLIDSLGSGGAQKQICLLAAGLVRLGVRVEVLAYFPQQSHFKALLEHAGVPLRSVRKSQRFSLTTPLAIAWIVLNEGFTCVISFLPTPSFYAAFAKAAGAVPCLITSERSSFVRVPPRWRQVIGLQIHRLANLVVCNSHHHARELAETCSWMANRIAVVANGVELPERPAPFAPATTVVRLLVLASVIAYKNFAGLIEGLGVLKGRAGVVPVIGWAGKRPQTQEDQLAFDRANQRLRDLGLEQNWIWLGERADVLDLLFEFDALMHPSLLEGFPNAVGEAMAAGRPVLVSAIGDIPRLVEDGRSGFVFDPRSPAAIADAMRRFCALTPPERTEMGRAARLAVESQMSSAAMAGGFKALAESLHPAPI